jgi:alkanesulfonate monooxygenase SsuD/methylene tetrahydromethanopterin reductase-like flavin-dependent oxidoreductase (luciferase family)
MEEAIQIIKLLWTEEKASFKGKHYEIKDAFCAPKPVQKPTPPIMIGGDGEKRTLKAVAKYADYCNLFMRPNLEHKLDVLKQHCKDVGRDYDDVGKSLFVAPWPGLFLSEFEEEIEAYISQTAERFQKTIEETREYYYAGYPGSWIGYREDVIERFQYIIGLGFDYFQVMFPGIGEDYIKASNMFAEKIMKKL